MTWKEKVLKRLETINPAKKGWYYPLFSKGWTGWRIIDCDNYLVCKGVYKGWAGEIKVFAKHGELKDFWVTENLEEITIKTRKKTHRFTKNITKHYTVDFVSEN